LNAKTIIRKAKDKQNPYAQIARSAAQDTRLSWKATGLLCYILSLPDDWQIYLKDLAKRKKDGISATRAALKELASAGYIEKISTRNDKGQFIKHEHLIHESPITINQKSNIGILDATKETLNKETESFDDLHGWIRDQDIEERRQDVFRRIDNIDIMLAKNNQTPATELINHMAELEN
jgi:hypothetical protein